MKGITHLSRGNCVVVAGILAWALLISLFPTAVAPSHAQEPPGESDSLAVTCPVGEVVLGDRVLDRATVTRVQPTMSPGPLFSDSGSFQEKPVDSPCDPGKELGPFPVSAGGKMTVHMTGSPAVENVWSLGNNGTGLTVVYEPLYGGVYGPGQKILAIAIPMEETEVEGEAEWPGPGQIRAYTGAPWGTGPMTGSCFEQSYTIDAEIVEVKGSAPLQPGMKLYDGDRIVTESTFGSATVEIISGGVAAGVAMIGPGSDLTLVSGGARVNVDVGGEASTGTDFRISAEADIDPAMGNGVEIAGRLPTTLDSEVGRNLHEIITANTEKGLPVPKDYWANPDGFWEGITLEEAQSISQQVQAIQDPNEAAVVLKLAMETHRPHSGTDGSAAYRLRLFAESRGQSAEQIERRIKAEREGIARQQQFLTDQHGGKLVETIRTVQQEIGRAEAVVNVLQNYRLPVARGEINSLPEQAEDDRNLRNLQRKAYDLSKAGYPMPEGYREDPTRFWRDYRPETTKAMFQDISAETDPCEAAVRFKLFMEAHPGQWTEANQAWKSADMAADIALIWIPPNEFDVVTSLAKWALAASNPWLAPVVAVSEGAKYSKNIMQTHDRLVKEFVVSAAQKKSERMYKAFDESKSMSEAEVQSEIEHYRREVAAQDRATRQKLTELYDKDVQLESRLNELDPDRNGGMAQDMSRVDELRKAQKEIRSQITSTLREGMDNILELQTYQSALSKYRLPIAREGKCKTADDPPQGPKDPCLARKGAELILTEGLLRVAETKGKGYEVLVKTGLQIEKKAIEYVIQPDGTQFSVEKREESATARVFDGAVAITSSDGQELRIEAGQQATLPDGTVSEFDLATDDGGPVDGIPLSDLLLDDGIPEPYGTYAPEFRDDTVPSDWVWQMIFGPDAPEASTLETPEAGVLRVTTPHGNNFGAYAGEAPRLLHKATGDFDLEAEMLLECEGTHSAFSEFMLYTPGRPFGYIEGQSRAEGLKGQYLMAAGGWAQDYFMRKLGAANRKREESPDVPDMPVRFKMSRRGDTLKTYWSDDAGETWTLSNRRVLPLPETLWAGWVFRRIAGENPPLYDKPNVTTLRDVRLETAPLGTMLEDEWDVVDFAGEVIPLGTELVMSMDGSRPGYVQAYSPWTIPGDFDLAVRFDAPPVKDPQPEDERYIYVGVSSCDETNTAYVRDALIPGWPPRRDADILIGGQRPYQSYQYEHLDAQDESGRFRLVRRGEILSSYYWRDGDWTLLGDWNTGFSDPVHLDLRFQWKTPEPELQTARFTIERLETPEGVWIGPAEEPQPPAAESDSGLLGDSTAPVEEGSTGFLGEELAPTPEGSESLEGDTVLVQPTAPALPLPADRAGIAEFIATASDMGPGQWVTLSWKTSGGEPDLFRLDENGEPRQESSDVLNPSGSMEVPIEGNPGDVVTFVLGLLSPDRSEWLETATLTVVVETAELPPLPIDQPGIAEFTATPTEAAPGETVTLSWRTSGGEPRLFRLDAAGQPQPVEAGSVESSGSVQVTIDSSTEETATFALGLLAPDGGSWIETTTLEVKVIPPEPPQLPLPEDSYEPPSLQPESQPVQPAFGPATFSSRFDEQAGEPAGVGSVFPTGTALVWVSWTYQGVIPETEYQYDWRANGQVVQQGRNHFWKESGVTWEWLGDRFTPLQPGTYTFFFSVNGQRYEAGSMTIEGDQGTAPTPQPTSAPAQVQPVPGAYTVFFSIDDNGNPSGYVYDKAGREYHPAEGTLTISGPWLKAEAGDRIYLRTDAPRFAMLWDCGTQGDSYSPCDFMADSPANMPGEIVCNASDALGNLNISGPDNWAGERSNFPGQRYPADPILRIVFGSDW